MKSKVVFAKVKQLIIERRSKKNVMIMIIVTVLFQIKIISAVSEVSCFVANLCYTTRINLLISVGFR